MALEMDSHTNCLNRRDTVCNFMISGKGSSPSRCENVKSRDFSYLSASTLLVPPMLLQGILMSPATRLRYAEHFIAFASSNLDSAEMDRQNTARLPTQRCSQLSHLTLTNT